ncbi:MAG: hypothetical protein CO163_04935 [Rhodobacterales bacterium CG_4_9_14_3_um_filter_71_31]|nr:MAG: hypothetical protein CO163_04935 [Rhodobacterales bacterium CG_4_9_14_3_um_filter_71_31]
MSAETDDPVAAYKRLLRELVARRPSGTRRRMAAAFGTHPSFISQITNPGLRVPLPAQHIPSLFRTCHFSAEEQAQFLALYGRAHPAQAVAIEELAAVERDGLRIALPPFADPAVRREVEDAIRDFADRVIRLAQHTKKS